MSQKKIETFQHQKVLFGQNLCFLVVAVGPKKKGYARHSVYIIMSTYHFRAEKKPSPSRKKIINKGHEKKKRGKHFVSNFQSTYLILRVVTSSSCLVLSCLWEGCLNN